MRFTSPPYLVRKFYPGMVWRVDTREKNIYLTFDDGPEPGITPQVLDILSSYDAKATFFCLGKKAAGHPGLVDRIRKEGHAAGNHTWDHPDGWKTRDEDYFENVERCNALLGSKLFRPPYGRISRSQIKALKKQYDLIMWDVLSWDFDSALSPPECAGKVCGAAREGSIVVFHDSPEAAGNMMGGLKATLEYFSEKGFGFAALS